MIPPEPAARCWSFPHPARQFGYRTYPARSGAELPCRSGNAIAPCVVWGKRNRHDATDGATAVPHPAVSDAVRDRPPAAGQPPSVPTRNPLPPGAVLGANSHQRSNAAVTTRLSGSAFETSARRVTLDTAVGRVVAHGLFEPGVATN